MMNLSVLEKEMNAISWNNTKGGGTMQRPTWYWVLRVIMTLLTVLGNGLVMYIIASRKRLRQRRSPNWYILSLAVADFCVGVYNGPSLFLYVWLPVTYSPETWAILEFFMNVFLIASVANLFALTLDRYLAIVHPFTHHNLVNSNGCLAMIVIAWMVALLQRIPFLVLKLNNAESSTFLRYQIFYIPTFVILPNIFMIYAYVRIAFVARRHLKHMRATDVQESSNSTTNPSNTRQRRLETRHRNASTAAVGVVIAIFLVCSSFLQYWLICNYFDVPTCNENESNIRFYAMVLMRYFNSAPNFFVYALMKNDFRNEVRSLFSCL